MEQHRERDRYALADLTEFQLPDGTIALRNRRTGREMTLPGQVFNAISYCHTFRTVDEHVADLARDNPAASGQEGKIRAILQSVIDGGLMQSAAELCKNLDPVQAAPVPEKPVVAVLTCDRPRSLERLLKSILANCELDRVHSLVVFDDSRNADLLTENAKAIGRVNAQLNRSGHPAFLHFDFHAATSLADAITEAIPEHEPGIRFLLDRRLAGNRVTTGMGHNHCMLLAAGRPLLVFDDDVLCEAHEPPATTPGVAFRQAPRSARFYRTTDDWSGYRADEGLCPISRHMRVLGKRLRETLYLLNRSATPDSFEYATLQFALSLDDRSWIGVTQCGSYGDPGTGGNQWLATLNSESRRQLLSVSDGVETALQHRNCWLGRTQPTFEMAANMSQLIGLDNRAYLPPRFPYFRGHDEAFGALASFVQADALSLDLPFALPHLPIPPRQWRAEDNTFTVRFSPFNHVSNYILQQAFRCGARDPLVRNETLAAHFHDFSDWPDRKLAEMYASHWFLQKAQRIMELQQVLDESADDPAEWIAYIKGAMSQYRDCQIPDYESELLDPQPTGRTDLRLLDFCRKAWREFAEGVRVWPKVREVAPQIIEDQVPNWSSARRE